MLYCRIVVGVKSGHIRGSKHRGARVVFEAIVKEGTRSNLAVVICPFPTFIHSGNRNEIQITQNSVLLKVCCSWEGLKIFERGEIGGES
jgi:hypothetical protein